VNSALDWTDRVLELQVDAVAHGGHCVARHDGRVVFVRHALPGERVRAVVDEDTGGGFCRADAVAVLAASPDRVAAPCTWARAGGCGGCDLQHVAPPAQRGWKAQVLAEQLARLAGVHREIEVEELPGGPLGWRTRVRLAVDDEGRAGLRAHRSHDVLAVADCPLAPPGALDTVLGRRFPAGAVDVVVDAGGAVHTTCTSDGRAGGDGTVGGRAGGGGAGGRRAGDDRAGGDGGGEDHAGDDGPVPVRAAGREWRLSPGVFWQVHPALPDVLAQVVGEWAAAPRGGTAWDLYGGVGLFAAVLAEQVGPDGSVTVVESARDAVDDGRAALADLPQVGWRVGRVEKVLTGLPDAPDVVVADPPRKGLGRAVVDALAAHGPAQVVYVACDPAALARDVAFFAGHGYTLGPLRAFDAFPMTHHMECVALLSRPT
jgi:tRNA/tmRNA/rRNA uracil-C5-methylase (TrmA/RlmC/RlmD family)